MLESTAVTLLERAAEFVAGLSAEAIPPRVIEKARLQAMSMLAAALSGARTRHARAVVDAALAWRTAGRATVLGRAATAHPIAAVTANAAASMALDFDDYLFAGHTGHSAVLVALACAEEADASVGDLLVAQVAANEIAGRFGASLLLGPHNGQMWSYIHLLGAAAAAGRIARLSADRLADAFAIALYQPPYPLVPGFMGAPSKTLTASTPAAIGLLAADLAARGLSGARRILESRAGFFARLARRPLPLFVAGLGERWVTDTLACKIYPGCAYVDAALDALLDLTGGNPAPPADIEVRATAFTWGMEKLSTPWQARVPPGRTSPRNDLGGTPLGGDAPLPLSPIAVNFSVRLSIAIAAMAGRLTPDECAPEFLEGHSADIRARAARVRLTHDALATARLVRATAPALLGGRFEDLAMPFSAEVRMDGRSSRVEIPRGAPGRPADETARLVRDKLARETPHADRVAALLGDPAARARDLGGAVA